MRRAPAPLLACALAALLAGCGSAGVSNGATVTAYVTAPLCAGAQHALKTDGGRAGDVRIRAICLPSETTARTLNLATVGANARKATEDSAAVAYLEAPSSPAARFAHPILESAGIPWIESGSGAAAMTRLLGLVRESDSNSLRDSVRESLHQP